MVDINKKIEELAKLCSISKEPKYHFVFSEEQMSLNIILDKYEKKYVLDGYNINFNLFLVKYPKDAIITLDEYEDFIVIVINKDDKVFVFNDILSFKSYSYEEVINDFNTKKEFYNKLESNKLLDNIIEAIKK